MISHCNPIRTIYNANPREEGNAGCRYGVGFERSVTRLNQSLDKHLASYHGFGILVGKSDVGLAPE